MYATCFHSPIVPQIHSVSVIFVFYFLTPMTYSLSSQWTLIAPKNMTPTSSMVIIIIILTFTLATCCILKFSISTSFSLTSSSTSCPCSSMFLIEDQQDKMVTHTHTVLNRQTGRHRKTHIPLIVFSYFSYL